MKSLGVFALLAGAAFAQTSFDMADVHVSPRKTWTHVPTNWMDGGVLGGDRYEVRRASILDLIRTAYGVDADKVFGGPGWLDYDRYDIAAKTKPGTKPAVLNQMLQTLLADRFHLVLKQESRPIQGFILTAAKGEPKMKRSEGEGSEGCQQGRPTFGNAPPPLANVQCRNISMEEFANWLHRPGEAPIQDSTGLDGTWDFDLQYPMMGAAGGSPPAFASLASIGLRAEPGKVPQQVLTVVSVDEQPTPNPAGVSQALPPHPPAAFEVASVRNCKADNMEGAPRSQAGERVTLTCEPLLTLIKQAFGLLNLQWPIGTPKSFDGRTDYSNVTIVAKATAGTPQDRDTMNAMLRALLIERYKMVFHYEDRPMDTATLTALKPKLTKADPAGRTGCVLHHPKQFTIWSQPVRLVCQDMTMGQFAEQIPVYDGDLFYPVENQTALEGAWDFTIDFDNAASRGMQALVTKMGIGNAPTPEGQAPEPVGGLSLGDAIQKQLGLTLEISKRPQPVLVIDHMEEKPSDN